MEQTNKNDIPVVILCGGRGTRLKEETEVIPKPLVKIGGYPILWHIMKIYSSYGYNRFILPVGYKGEKIKEYFLNYASLTGDLTVDFSGGERQLINHTNVPEKWKITIVDTGLNTETGARIKRIKPYVKDSDFFLLTYGDGVSDAKIDSLVNFHKSQGKTVTVTGVRQPARFGAITIQNSIAVSFMEKSQVRDGYINGGFFVLDRNIFGFLDEREDIDFSKEILPKLAQAGELAVFRHDGYWQCMDTFRDMEFLNEEWIKGEAKWKIWEA